ncbi:hypothetical protein PFISCL1PPCAC_8620 [Pristionchus fissidentatus]|uniref:Uncharacterized protein n=1 Tax=Pristionchus fissidentatus TaxID=1538716 RepID=A0AAV5VGD8_9BILA|nr:hypothetical protein PFISCL1PPCAC_8620 [Pristionchus fissidentatus]
MRNPVAVLTLVSALAVAAPSSSLDDIQTQYLAYLQREAEMNHPVVILASIAGVLPLGDEASAEYDVLIPVQAKVFLSRLISNDKSFLKKFADDNYFHVRQDTVS